MKISLILTALIVVICGVLGWHSAQEVSAARKDREALIAEAQALGANTDDLSQKDPARHLSRRTRAGGVDREAETKAFATRLIAFANRIKATEKSGQERDEGIEKETAEIIGTMLKLDQGQLKQLIGELKTSPDLDGEMRSQIIGFAIMMMAGEHPAAALALYTESADLMQGKGMGTQVVASALAKLAQTDPAAAMDWIRQNSEAHADLINDRVKIGILSGAAKQDPKLAFSLMSELGLTGNPMAAASITDSANTPAERLNVLQAMRDYMASTPGASDEIVNGTLRGLASKAVVDGYDSTMQWLDNAKMTPQEIQAFANNLAGSPTKDDTGKWIDWMSDKLPDYVSATRIHQMVVGWTQQDYKAAGAWINDSKSGPTKDSAVYAYALTVALYEPESAAQWALTLPEGQQKTGALNHVYSQWKQKDPAAAENFAKAHGLGQ